MKLIDKYLPSDYNDSISKRIKTAEPLSPDYVFEEMFCKFPNPVEWLFKLRNAVVKPLGIQGGSICHNRCQVEQLFRQNILHRDMGVSQNPGKEFVPENIGTYPAKEIKDRNNGKYQRI